jgi:LDH2 family malate/lactate/ureidoglycolate dehydrogenase
VRTAPAPNMTHSRTISVPQLTAFTTAAFRAHGLVPADADIAANALVLTDAMGVYTHGTKLLAGYLRKLAGGGYQAAAQPQIEREGPGWAVVDADSALGQIGGSFGMRTALEKASQVGIAYVGVRNTGHIGAAGVYAATAARAGFIAMVTGNDIPSVAAPGSRRAVLGSNPIAYGIPVTDGDPIVLDMATAAVAGGKIYAARQRDEPIPATWLIDSDGHPTTDGRLFPERASLAPMSGHKGYGLGLWCEILSALLPGGHATWQVGSWIFDDPSRPSRHNAGFVVLDVAAISDPIDFQRRLRALIDEIHAAPTTPGVDRVLLPGEREWQNYRRALAEGITLPGDVAEQLLEVARSIGREPNWTQSTTPGDASSPSLHTCEPSSP